VKPGEHLAIVGGSGSGKSTILRLLLGFEKPMTGSLAYDGQELAGLDPARVRAQIGVVLQSSQLFAGSIFENIRGATNASLEQCALAAERAGLASDLQIMPMGLHTPITEGAGTLSGGQRQRILIARALAAEPAILFFDEATSALDNATQAIVARTLDAMQATRITIAHRLSTVRNADRICVLERGRFVETGSFAELMALNGAFAALARRQLLED
jgi:ABC-type bacteriocin/lantibiotic exporter with double-glycine peptidase domain